MLGAQHRCALDAIRAIAALYVVLHHVSPLLIGPPFLYLFKFGQEAVIVFFLLSGFVIHANERTRVLAGPSALGAYATRRVLRLYPTLIAAMCVSVAVAYANGTLAATFSTSETLCNLASLQDRALLNPGTICPPFLGNAPLWSLSYEVVFYLLYPAILRLFLAAPNRTHHLIGLGTLALIAAHWTWPHHMLLLPSYFVIWWCGAMLAEAHLAGRRRIRSLAIPLAYLGAATLVWGGLFASGDEFVSFGLYPFLQLRHLGFAFLLTLVAFVPFTTTLLRHLGSHFAGGWAWLSSISYGIYLLHFPLMVQWSGAQSTWGLIGASAMVVAFAYVFDRKSNDAVRAWRARRATSGPIPPGSAPGLGNLQSPFRSR